MPRWTAVPDGDVTRGSWVKETGTGTPIFGEIDEGPYKADNTGIKVTSSASSVGAAQFTLSSPPDDLFNLPSPGVDWTSNAQGSIAFGGVEYANGYWVVAGELNATAGVIYYKANSPDGAWTANNQGTLIFNEVAYGNGYWVAVGDAGTLRYTTNPTTAWTLNAQGTSIFRSVAYGNGYWVGVGDAGKLYYRANDPTGAWTSNTQGTANLWDVVYANGYWVAVGDGGTVRYTTDPTGAWTLNTQGATSLQDLDFLNGYWVAVGLNGTMYYKANTPDGAWTSNTQATNHLRGLAYANGYWVAVGFLGYVIYKFGDDPSGAWTVKTQGTLDFRDVIYANNHWVAVGASGNLYYLPPVSKTIFHAALVARIKTSGRNDDDVSLPVQIYKDDGTTAVDTPLTNTTAGTILEYRSQKKDLDAVIFNNLTYAELHGLRVSVSGSKTTVNTADTVTYYVDAIVLELEYESASTTLVPDGDVSLGSWVKETGSGTPIFGEIDEGIAGDGTGIKVTSNAATIGAAQFTLSNPSGDIKYGGQPRNPWTFSTALSFTTSVGTIVYGNGYWVAAATGSSSINYATSPNGTWTSQAVAGMTNGIDSVAYAEGYWVAVGAGGESAYRASTPNGTWTSNPQGTLAWNKVLYSNGYWVMVGDNGSIRYKAATPVGAWTANTQGTATFYGLAYGNGYWVAGAAGGVLRYKAGTPDGTWSSVTLGTADFTDVAFGNGAFIAAKSGGVLTYYNDTTPDQTWGENESNGYAYCVAYGDGYWVVGTLNGVFCTNPYHPSGGWEFFDQPQGSSASYGTDLFNVAYGDDGYWVMVGELGDMFYAAPEHHITAAQLRMRIKVSGRSDDTVSITAQIYKANGTTAVGTAFTQVVTATTYTTYSTFIDESPFAALTKTELNGLIISLSASNTKQGLIDTVTYYVDAVELVLSYDNTTQPEIVIPIGAVNRASRW